MSFVNDPLLFRADAAARTGSGHLMRCLALAEAWQDAGGCAQFATVRPTLAIEARLAAEGIEVTPLSTTPGSPQDAAETIALARKLKAQWVVADGYDFDASFQEAFKAAGLSLLFMDDYGHAKHYCADLVLNQNIYAEDSFYASREPTTRLLLGTRYVLLRREFLSHHDRHRETAPQRAHRVLVTLGGSDPENCTLKVVEALESVDADKLEAVVVVGGNYLPEHDEKLQAAIKGARNAIRLARNVSDMPGLMAWADTAVSGGGTTCYEMAFMGLPNLVIVLAENQRAVAEAVDEKGLAVNLGWHAELSPVKIAEALTRLVRSTEERALMSERGQALVDGKGADRVLKNMEGKTLKLRRVREEDSRLLWEWANDREARRVSFSSEPIPWEQHVKWFQSKLNDPRCVFYIVEDAGGTPIAQARFDMDENEAVISVSVGPDFRGNGYGSMIIRLASLDVFRQVESVRLIHAYIKEDNQASVSVFAKAGYVDAGRREIQGHEALQFILKRDELN